MTEQRTADHRRQLMDRHARVSVLIDRLHAQWDLCILDIQNGDYEAVDEAWKRELIEELRWLNDLYAEALATEGDVRRCLSPTVSSAGTEHNADV
jgi:hypothetical protein